MGVWAAPGVIARMAGVSERHVKEVNEQIGAPLFDMLTAHMSVMEWRSPGSVGELSKPPVQEVTRLANGVFVEPKVRIQFKIGEIHPSWRGPLDYSDINPKNPGPFKNFTKSVKDKIYAKNKEYYDGYIVSDKDGTILEAPKKSQAGVTPSEYEAQIDHIDPKSKGGV